MSEDDAYINKLAAEMARGVAPDLFEHEMYTNSKVLGRDGGVVVVIGGDKAQTDGKTVVLPALDKHKVVSNEAANVARGFVNHESGHLRFTNGLTVKRFARHEQHMSFLNGMEDVRMEKKFADQYPGSMEQFSYAANATLRRFIKQVETGEIKIGDKAKLVPMATAWAGRRKMGQALETTLMEKLEKLTGVENMKVAEYLADESLKATGTLDIARFLEKWLGKVDPETEAEKKKHEDDGGMGAPGGSPMGAPPEPGFAPPAGGYHEPDMAGAVGDMLPTGGGSTAYKSNLEEDKIWDLDKYMAPGGGASSGENRVPTVTEYKRNYLYEQSTHKPRHVDDLRKLGLQNVEFMKTHLGPSVRAVKMALERGLIVAKQRNWDPGQSRGNIDPKRLATVLTGSRNFYRRRSALEMIDTAVTLLIDMSGSMCNEKAVEAMKAAYVFAESLTKVGVPIEVLGFVSDRAGLKKPMSRSGVIDIIVYKKFVDSMQSGMWKVGLVTNATMLAGGHQNADGDSLLHAWRRLRTRPEPRKVLIVFSDGMPCTHGTGDENYHLKRVVHMLIAQGCETFGVGIMTDSVKRFYPEHIVISKAEDLATKAGEFLKNLLLPQQMRQKRARKELKAAA
jgi:cobalamin biosynthesis protein CobT